MSPRLRRSIFLLLGTTVLAVAPVSAQSVGVSASVAEARVSRETPTGLERQSGTLLGVEGIVSISYFGVSVRYHQGGVTGASAVSRDFVEGEAMVWVRPHHTVSVSAGPHVRALVTPDGTERWVFFEVRVRGNARLVGPFRAYAAGWRVMAANANVAERFNTGFGIEGGLGFALDRLPLHVSARVRTERARLGDGARLETVEQLALVVGFGRY